MFVDTAIKNGKIVAPSGIYEGAIAIESGKIVAIAKEANLPKANFTIDATGKFIVPGLIDTHVHVCAPGFLRETFETGTRAAAVGGITMILEMPSGPGKHTTMTVEGLKWKKSIGEKRSVVDFGLYGGYIQKEEDFSEIAGLVGEGVLGFKIMMSGGLAVENDGVLFGSLKLIARAKSTAVVHSENNSLIKCFTDRLVSEGRKDPSAHFESRPNIVEAEAISRVIWFSDYMKTRVHVPHMSTKEGVELMRNAKQRGQEITAETCPHFLLFTKEDLKKYGPNIITNPPVRSKQDLEALWHGLASGAVDNIATDHCAFTRHDKAPGWDDVWSSPAGVPGLETLAMLVLSEGVNKNRLTLEQFVSLTSENPARMFGLFPLKGVLRVGSDADITILDIKKQKVIRSDQMKCAADYTPYDGRKVKGAPILTMVRGTVVAQDGEVVGKKGGGKFIFSKQS